MDKTHSTFTQALLYIKNTPEAEKTASHVRQILQRYNITETSTPAQNVLGIVIGGDGSFLYAAAQAVKIDMPLVGINLGRVGFLTTISAEDIHTHLASILEGHAYVDTRPMFMAKIGENEEVFLNDLTLNRKTEDKMVEVAISTQRDGQKKDITTFRADGLVVSTPTGSTAYNLSAGGPIMHPDVEALTLTPVCPHTLQLRPVVLPPQHVILTLASQTSAILTVDGRFNFAITPETSVTISPTGHIRVLHAEPRNFFGVLQEKLGWQQA